MRNCSQGELVGSLARKNRMRASCQVSVSQAVESQDGPALQGSAHAAIGGIGPHCAVLHALHASHVHARATALTSSTPTQRGGRNE